MASPAESFTLADVQRETGINPASAHAVMTTLMRSGYVRRHTDTRLYSLGPATAAAGVVALEQQPAIRIARERVDDLSRSLALEVLITAATDDEMIVVGRSSGSFEFGSVIHVGQRIPLHPPMGVVFLAWSSQQAVERWLDRSSPALTTSAREELLGVLDITRRRGFCGVIESAAARDMSGWLSRTAGRDASAGRSSADEHLSSLMRGPYHLGELDDDEVYDVNNLAAPIFDGSGRVAAAVAVNGLPAATGGEQIRVIATRVRGLAQIVTKEIYGQPPAHIGRA